MRISPKCLLQQIRSPSCRAPGRSAGRCSRPADWHRRRRRASRSVSSSRLHSAATPAAMIAPMLVPPRWSNGTPASVQRLHDADMGEAARAAAGEHEPDGAAGDEARQTADVVGVAGAHMMMRFEQPAAQREMLRQRFARRSEGCSSSSSGSPLARSLKRRQIERAQRQRLVGAREQENAVGLTLAQMRPRRCPGRRRDRRRCHAPPRRR